MNINVSKSKSLKVSKPNSFVEATVSLADCYQNALEEGVKGNDDLTRFWVDASRSVKSFFKRYQEETEKNQLISGLEKNKSKEILAEAIKNIRQAEPFIMAWAAKFRSLRIRDFNDFHEFHWDLFLDEVVPLTWDWESDLFIIQHKHLAILETLLKRGQVRIILIEPNQTQFKKLGKYVETLENSEQVHVVKSKDEIKKIISVWIDHPPHFSRVISSSLMPTEEEKKKELEEIQKLAREGMINAITFDTTIKAHGNTWIENGLNNFENLVNHPHMSCLNKKFRKESLIVVSPGPSLEKNIHLLEKAKGKAIIMAVSHSLEYLRARKIVPDVVVHVDPNVNIDKYFAGFPFEEVELLILSATAAPDLFDLPTKNKVWLYANAYFDNWLMGLLDIEDYTLWGSCVSVAALKLAYVWGCKNVALIGQDLSFTDGNYYAGATYAPKEVIATFEESVRAEGFKLPGYYGEEVLTKNDYRLYHGQFQDLATDINKKSKIKLYNATEGGANIEGFTNISLESFISNIVGAQLNKKENDFRLRLKKCLVRSVDVEKAKRNITKTKKHLTEVNKLLQLALKKTDILDTQTVDSVNLANLQKKTAKKLKSSMVLKIALQDSLQNVASSDSFMHNQRGYLEKGTEMYRACLIVIHKLSEQLGKINLR